MIEVKITDNMMSIARKKAGELGCSYNSILRGAGNFSGFLGESIANSIINGSICNTYDYDILLKDGRKIDVKTKQTTVIPKVEYECSVANYNTKQECNIYLFTRIKKDFSVGQLLGWLYKEEYFKKARFLKKGDVDGSNKFTVRADCYNVAISELNAVDFLKEGY